MERKGKGDKEIPLHIKSINSSLEREEFIFVNSSGVRTKVSLSHVIFRIKKE